MFNHLRPVDKPIRLTRESLSTDNDTVLRLQDNILDGRVRTNSTLAVDWYAKYREHFRV